MRLIIALAISLFLSHTGLAQTDWPQLKYTQVATGIANPTHLNHAGDGSGRLFAVEQGGRIKIVKDGAVYSTPFLDITNRVLSGGERGLLSVAFPPGFAGKKYFYVDYTRTNDGTVVVSRFNVSNNPDVADAASEQVILTIPHPVGNHNGGQTAFGPDGYLYISVGDGGGAYDGNNQAQNTGLLLGKLLRIDVEGATQPYGIPPNNPLVGNAAARPEIWAYGLRNPWRFSFDRTTGDLYIGDVGQDDMEEVDFQEAGSAGGLNYGWRLREGLLNLDLSAAIDGVVLTPPIHQYPRTDGSSVTGGHVYRGPDFPRMQGIYFFSDYGSRKFWGLKRENGVWRRFAFPNAASSISTFGEDEAGRLYFGTYSTGRIYLVEDNGKAVTPVFDPPAGIASDDRVYLQSSVGAVVHYTTDGSDPTDASPGITSGESIPLAAGATLKAMATREGLLPSDIASATYTTLKVASPSIDPKHAEITNGTPITITTATPGATIRYSLTGTPNASSPVYTGPVSVDGSQTLRAYATRAGFADTTVVFYTFPWATLDPPALLPDRGSITNGTLITMSNIMAAATIYYTLDGSTPTTNSLIYAGPVAINGNTTLTAFAGRAGYRSSTYKVGTYPLVRVVGPSFVPASGVFTNPTPVTITTTTPGATIRYTLDDTDPTTNSPVYTGPLILSGGTALRAIAYRDDLSNSFTRTTFFEMRSNERTVVSTLAGSGTMGPDDGTGPAAQFNQPHGICLDRAGNLMVADLNNHRIRRITPAGEVSTFSGTGVAGQTDGPANTAQFSQPIGIGSDGNDVFYVADIGTFGSGRLMRVDAAGNVTTLLTQVSNPRFLEADSAGYVYYTASSQAVKYGPNLHVSLTTGLSISASLGVALAPDGTVYVSIGEGTVQKVVSVGSSELFAGGSAGFSDGPRLKARFDSRSYPRDCAVDRLGNLYVCDYTRIRKIRPNGVVTTLAGGPTAGFADGPGNQALFNDALGICVTSNGVVFVTEAANQRIRKIVQYDWDDDGIPDVFETEGSGYVLGANDSAKDSDGDGVTDALEYVAGTDPHDATSLFAIRDLATAQDGKMNINWRTAAGRVYQVQYSDDMVTWSNLGAEITGDGETNSTTDTIATASTTRRFYRIIVREP